MARSRNIKPGFFTNDVLAEAHPLARLLFIGLWCHADREGRLHDRPKKIKAEILPYDDCDADAMLTALARLGFIVRYEVCGARFIQVLNFVKHQNPHVKEQASEIPAPDLSGASTVQVPEEHGTSRADSILLIPDSLNPLTDTGFPSVGAANAPQRQEPADHQKKQKRGSVLPDDFEPDEKGKALARELGLFQSDLEKFRDHHRAKGSVMKDWQAAWRTWCRNTPAYGRAASRLSPPANKQQALEERNRQVAEKWVPPEMRGQEGGVIDAAG